MGNGEWDITHCTTMPLSQTTSAADVFQCVRENNTKGTRYFYLHIQNLQSDKGNLCKGTPVSKYLPGWLTTG